MGCDLPSPDRSWDLGYELRQHARARLDIWLSTRAGGDGARHGLALLAVATLRLALSRQVRHG